MAHAVYEKLNNKIKQVNSLIKQISVNYEEKRNHFLRLFTLLSASRIYYATCSCIKLFFSDYNLLQFTARVC